MLDSPLLSSEAYNQHTTNNCIFRAINQLFEPAFLVAKNSLHLNEKLKLQANALEENRFVVLVLLFVSSQVPPTDQRKLKQFANHKMTTCLFSQYFN